MGSNGATGSDAGFDNNTKSQLSKRNQAKADKKSKAEANVEMGLGKDRMSNYSIAQGGTRPQGGGGDNNGNQVVQAPVPKVDVAPTTAEVSQVASIQAEDPIELRKRKAKAKGRSPTILTGIKGVEEGLTLGKPSLLGRA